MHAATHLFRTIASDRVDGAEPSVARHERKLVQSAAHLVALAQARRGRAQPWRGGGFDGISGSEAVATWPRPPWSWGGRQIKKDQRYTHALQLTGNSS